jgi:hypothetical protein
VLAAWVTILLGGSAKGEIVVCGFCITDNEFPLVDHSVVIVGSVDPPVESQTDLDGYVWFYLDTESTYYLYVNAEESDYYDPSYATVEWRISWNQSPPPSTAQISCVMLSVSGTGITTGLGASDLGGRDPSCLEIKGLIY